MAIDGSLGQELTLIQDSPFLQTPKSFYLHSTTLIALIYVANYQNTYTALRIMWWDISCATSIVVLDWRDQLLDFLGTCDQCAFSSLIPPVFQHCFITAAAVVSLDVLTQHDISEAASCILVVQ